jgi:hypothetical protein
MSLFEICQAIEQSTVSSVVRDSAFPYIEGAHVLALSLSIGTVMWFDLRLLGAAMRTRPVGEVFDDVKPWMFAGFGIMFSTGALLFAAHATKAYSNSYFQVKLALIMLAGVNAAIYHFTIDRSRSAWGKAPVPPAPARMAGLVSLLLWFSVIAVGRIFAYSI